MTHVQRKHFISSFTPHNLSQLSQNFCVILTLISRGKSNLFQVVSPHCKFASTAFASSLPNVKQVRPTFTSLSPKRSTRSLASSPQNVFISCRNFPDMFRPTCNLCTAIKKPLGGKLTKAKRKRTCNRAKSLVTIKLHQWYRTSQVVRQLPSRAPLLNFNIKYKIVFL